MASHLEKVLDCFVRMDVEGLELLLSDQFTYSDVSKEKFLEAAEILFQDYRNEDPPTFQFQIFPGACCNKSCDLHLGTTAYRFLGASEVYTDIRFILEEKFGEGSVVKDIHNCNQLMTYEFLPEVQMQRMLWVFEDDKITTQLPPDYVFHLSQAITAESSWKNKTKDFPIQLIEVRSWLAVHENLFHDLGGYPASHEIIWKWDKFLVLFSNLTKFVQFLDDLEPHLQKFSEINRQKLPESELLPWIVEVEKLLEKKYSKVYGWFYELENLGTAWHITIYFNTRFQTEDPLITELKDFLSWFEKERKRLFDHYFSMTSGEVDQFIDQAKYPYEIYRVITLVSYHLEIRERFKKQGIFIPFDLGRDLDLEQYRLIT
jgi:hypothetical protein